MLFRSIPYKFNLKVQLVFALLILFSSCTKSKKTIKSTNSNTESISSIKFAKGFHIQKYNGYAKLIIKSPYPDAEQYQEFILISDKESDFDGKNKIYTPVKKLVATSTTHIPMIEILGETNSLIGFPNTNYISSQRLVNESQIIKSKTWAMNKILTQRY